jgi:flagellar biosynthetic protein FliR
VQPFAFPQDIYFAGLVFLRVGAIVMLLPGIGEAFVPTRIRLGFALLLSLCLGPIARPSLAALPGSMGDLGGVVLHELIAGLIMGGLLRYLLSALAVAGEVVSMQSTLGFAQTANPLQAQPGTAIASFLALLGVTLIFATNLHHLFIAAIARSYTLFAPARHVLIQDAAGLSVRTAAQTFALGIQLAAPMLVFSVVFQIATGLVGRVMPQFQIFFASTPLTIILALSIFALSLGAGTLVWLEHYQDFLRPLT